MLTKYDLGYEDRWVKVTDYKLVTAERAVMLYHCKSCDTEHQTEGTRNTHNWCATCAQSNNVKLKLEKLPKVEKAKLPKLKPQKIPEHILQFKHRHFTRLLRLFNVCEEWKSFDTFFNDTYPTFYAGASIRKINEALPIGRENFMWSSDRTSVKLEHLQELTLKWSDSSFKLIDRTSGARGKAQSLTFECRNGHLFTRSICGLNTAVRKNSKGHCPHCKLNNITKKQKLEQVSLNYKNKIYDLFLKRLNSNHKGTIRMTEIFKGVNVETEFYCSKHKGYFYAIPNKLSRLKSCVHCKQKAFKTKVNEHFLNTIGISNAVEVLYFDKVKHPAKFKCRCGTVYKVRYANDIFDRRYSCSRCASKVSTTFDYTAPATLYYVRIKFKDNYVYKIGITQASIARRFRDECGQYRIKVLQEIVYDVGLDAYEEEQRIIRDNKTYLLNCDTQVLSRTKNTEIFHKDILGLDK